MKKTSGLQLCRRRTHGLGRGKYQSVGPQCRVDLAFNVEQRHKSLSRMFHLGPKAIALNRVCVAEVFMRQQLSWLQKVRFHCEDHPPEVCCTRRAWDETRQLVLSALLTSGTKPVRDHVEVMVSSLRMVLVSASDSPQGGVCLDIVCPPCPLLTNSSANILAALEYHPLLVDTVKELEKIRRASRIQIHTNEFDGASGNDKLHAIMTRHKDWVDEKCGYEVFLCLNHSQHLVTCAVLSMIDLNQANYVLSASSFISGHGHWARLCHCVDRIVAEKFRVTYDKPLEDNGHEEYAMEICHLVMRNEKSDLECDEFHDDLEKGRHIQQRLFVLLQEFIAVFNTPWWQGDGFWSHRCRRDGTCCTGSSDQERLASARARASRAIRGVLLRKKPGKVATNKWTKLGPAFQFFVFGLAPHNMLLTLCEEAYKGVSARYTKAFTEEPGGE